MTNWTIEIETKTQKTTKGNSFDVTRYVVYHNTGFNAFTTFEAAKSFVNGL